MMKSLIWKHMNESISLTDFTLDDFRVELSNYLENNRKKLKDAPLGLYAVVPSPSGNHGQYLNLDKFSEVERKIIKPGIVYCLKQKGDTDGNEEVNPLQPYFLIYIWEDGQVRFNYTNAKQILEIYRLLCQGNITAFQQLCDLFNTETDNGTRMEPYADLLKKAVDEIIRVFKKRITQRVLTDRAGLIIPQSKQVNEGHNFELVTWLVIK